MKINITTPDDRRLMIEAEKCFSWGVQKSDKYESYSLPLVFRNDSEILKTLKTILQKCKDHLPDNEFGNLLYENQERGTVTICETRCDSDVTYRGYPYWDQDKPAS